MDYIVIDGDKANFLPNFGAAIVVPRPGEIKAKGAATLNGKKVCIEGDESSVTVSGCIYTTASHPIPGTGTLLIDALSSDQLTQHTHTDGTPIILKGKHFKAKFQIQQPAMQPGVPPTPDSNTEYKNGKGFFITSNKKFKGT